MEGYLGILNAGTMFGGGGGMSKSALERERTKGHIRHRTITSDIDGKRCPVNSSRQLCIKLCILRRTQLIPILYTVEACRS